MRLEERMAAFDFANASLAPKWTPLGLSSDQNFDSEFTPIAI